MNTKSHEFLEFDQDERKTRWTDEEDEKMLALVKKHGRRWTVICCHLPGRSDNAVKNRYHTFFRPAEAEEGPAKKHKSNKHTLPVITDNIKTKRIDVDENPTSQANPCCSTQLPTLPDEGGMMSEDDKDDGDFLVKVKKTNNKPVRSSYPTRRVNRVTLAQKEKTNHHSAKTEVADDTLTIAHKFTKSFDECHLTSNSSPVLANTIVDEPDQFATEGAKQKDEIENHIELLLAAYRLVYHRHQQQKQQLQLLVTRGPLPCFKDLCEVLVKDKLLSLTHQDDDMVWLRLFLNEQLRLRALAARNRQ